MNDHNKNFEMEKAKQKIESREKKILKCRGKK